MTTTKRNSERRTLAPTLAIIALLSTASTQEAPVRIVKDAEEGGWYGFRVVRTVSGDPARQHASTPLPPVPTNLVSFPPTPADLPMVRVDQLHERQRTFAQGLGVGPISTNRVGMKLVLIPPGRFMMGSPTDERGRRTEELQHEVELTRAFWISAHEVTQEQYARVEGRNPSRFEIGWRNKHNPIPLGPAAWRHPVENVSWFDAVSYCNRLSELEGLKPYYGFEPKIRRADGAIIHAVVTVLGGDGYRLPTEAEWEYACRATTPTPYYFGFSESKFDDIFPEVDKLPPQEQGVTTNINLGMAKVRRDFAVVFTGLLEVTVAGQYGFHVKSDDGCAVFVNNKTVVNHGGLHDVLQEKSGTVELNAGRHPFKCVFFQGAGGFSLNVEWTGPGFAREAIPAARFTHRTSEAGDSAPGLAYAYYTADVDNGWVRDNSNGHTHPVGEKKPNAFGLYDLLGNVNEWCHDESGTYSSKPVKDPTGCTDGVQGGFRICRGGSFIDQMSRSAARYRRHQSLATDPYVCGSHGFRVIRTVDASSRTELPQAALPNPPMNLPWFPADPSVLPVVPTDRLHDRQVTLARDLGIQPIRTNRVGMVLMLIPAGKFIMGSPVTEKWRHANAEVQHEVVLTRSYWMAAHTVTQEQFARLMGRNPSLFAPERFLWNRPEEPIGPQAWRTPVEGVSRLDAYEFCDRLSILEGLKPYYGLQVSARFGDGGVAEGKTGTITVGGEGYRLPTEAEWEYACRAGTTTAYSFGDDEGQLEEYAWTSKNSGGHTHPVGQKKPNPFGLFDMHGNIWQWTDSGYHVYPSGPVTDPPGHGSHGILRGGYWSGHGGAGICRSACRVLITAPTVRWNGS